MSTHARTITTYSIISYMPSIPLYPPFISHSQRPAESNGSGVVVVVAGSCEENFIVSDCASFRRGTEYYESDWGSCRRDPRKSCSRSSYFNVAMNLTE